MQEYFIIVSFRNFLSLFFFFFNFMLTYIVLKTSKSFAIYECCNPYLLDIDMLVIFFIDIDMTMQASTLLPPLFIRILYIFFLKLS